MVTRFWCTDLVDTPLLSVEKYWTTSCLTDIFTGIDFCWGLFISHSDDTSSALHVLSLLVPNTILSCIDRTLFLTEHVVRQHVDWHWLTGTCACIGSKFTVTRFRCTEFPVTPLITLDGITDCLTDIWTGIAFCWGLHMLWMSEHMLELRDGLIYD